MFDDSELIASSDHVSFFGTSRCAFGITLKTPTERAMHLDKTMPLPGPRHARVVRTVW